MPALAPVFTGTVMLLGTHISISGGYQNAVSEAARLGIDTMQIFTKNQRMWKEKTVTPDEGAAFRKACAANGIRQVFSHAIYLVSLGTADEEIAQKSMLSLAMELERCRELGLTHTVVHPGGAGTLEMKAGIKRIAQRIKKVLAATKGNPVKMLIENTAGQGTSVGGKMEHIGMLLEMIGSKRTGMCFDTCHAYAAGYDIRTERGMDDIMKQIRKHIGMDRLLCFHLNDSKGALGSRIDRHEHIGKGQLGLEPFRYVLRNFPDRPKVLETSKEEEADVKNLNLLRKLSEDNTAK